MAPRSQPYRLRFTSIDGLPSLVTNIDEMFEQVYQDLGDVNDIAQDASDAAILTIVNDDNVTGAITAAIHTLTLGWQGILSVLRGGTGLNSYAVGDLLYASGASALSRLADVATGNVLLSGGVGVAPAWGKVSLATAITGVLPVANGGTGASTASGARTNLGLAIGVDVEGWDADLDALAALASTGMLARTGAGAFALRTLTAGTGISISNGDGVAGNPTISVQDGVWSVLSNGDPDIPELVWDDEGGVISDFIPV